MDTPTKTPSPLIMIVAGELSGDMHAASLVKGLKKNLPGARFFGIGGERMRTQGVDTLYDVKDMAVMGFSEVLRRYGFFRKVFNHMLSEARTKKPDVVILVDYPGFNLRFAKRIHAMGIRTVYYICPQVWAWNRARIPRMARTLDQLVTIFPFEVDIFKGTGLRVDFAGHPLADEATAARAERPAPLPWRGETRIALLPGSRRHEIARILPSLLDTAQLIEDKRPDAAFIIAAPSVREESIIKEMINARPHRPQRLTVVTGNTRQILRQAHAALVTSGTATIEAALMECPMVVVYKMAAMTYLLGRLLVRIPHIGMVNVVAGKEICPEFVQADATPQALSTALLPLLDETPERTRMKQELQAVRTALESEDAAQRAADLIAEGLGSSTPPTKSADAAQND